tara:strand:- start:441 stop:710 length:270 start_codon:yes stop_codon:yes gene_type:complete
MWILLTVIISASNTEANAPVYLRPILYDTIEKCELNLDLIYSDLIKLTYNYPVEVKVEYDENNKKYLKYSYKTDYTKPEKTKYYHCKKI